MTALGPFSTDFYLPGLPAMSTALRLTASQSQQTISIFFVGLAAGQLLYGPLSDRWGRRPALLCGLVLYAVGSAACAVAPNVNMLYAARLIQAFGGCAGLVIVRLIVQDSFPRDRVIGVFALLTLIMTASPILAPVAGGVLLLVADWRWLFAIQSFVGVLLGLSAAFTLSETRPGHVRDHASTETALNSYRAALCNRRVLCYIVISGSAAATLYTWVASSATVLISIFGVSPQAFGLFFAVNTIGMVAAAQLNVILARRLGSDEVLWRLAPLWFLFSGFLLFAAISRVGGAAVPIGLLFLLVSGTGFIQSNALAGAIGVDPKRPGSVIAVVGALTSTSGAAAAALSSAFQRGTLMPIALTMVLAAGFGLLGTRAMPRAQTV
jgi:DHA1 family bicyclomycin/chloramphenicol resistance-like MFS transporter